MTLTPDQLEALPEQFRPWHDEALDEYTSEVTGALADALLRVQHLETELAIATDCICCDDSGHSSSGYPCKVHRLKVVEKERDALRADVGVLCKVLSGVECAMEEVLRLTDAGKAALGKPVHLPDTWGPSGPPGKSLLAGRSIRIQLKSGPVLGEQEALRAESAEQANPPITHCGGGPSS